MSSQLDGPKNPGSSSLRPGLSGLSQQSPPVKLGSVLVGGRGALALPQHIKSPLARPTEEYTGSSGDPRSGPSQVRRETVEIDPLLVVEDEGGLQPQGHSILPPLSSSYTPTPTPPSAPPSSSSTSSSSLQTLSGSSTGESPQTPSSSLQEETAAFLARCRTVPLDPQTVPPTLAGLKTFAQASAWKYVVELSEKLLASSSSASGFGGAVGPDGLSYVLRIRLEGLFRMKMFDELSHEVSRILAEDAEKKKSKAYCENRSDDLSVAMHLLMAEVLSLTGRGDEALTQLHLLKKWLSTTPQNVNAPFWLWKSSGAIVNGCIRQRLWRNAISELTNMLDEVHSAASSQTNWTDKERAGVIKAEVILLCRLSRIMLQMGSIKAAVTYCERAQKALTSSGGLLEADETADHVELARGLTLFAQDRFEPAISIFGAILSRDHGRQTSDTFDVLSAKSLQAESSTNPLFSFLAGIELEETLLSVAANNFAVAALHLRKMSTSVSKLESLICDDPVRYLTDPIVFNLCTLYELSCSLEVSTSKKKILQSMAMNYRVEDPILSHRSLRL